MLKPLFLRHARHPVQALSLALSLTLTCLWTGCKNKSEPSSAETLAKTSAEFSVTTANPNYHRLHSHVLVRKIHQPTLANLDYAAYVENVMLADSAMQIVQLPSPVDLVTNKFGGLVQTFQLDIDKTPLTTAERSSPLAWTPCLDLLLQWNFEATAPLANGYSAVTGEHWGDTSDVPIAYQEFTSLYLHGQGETSEAWALLEFKPWMKAYLPAGTHFDAAGFGQIWVKLNPTSMTAAMISELRGAYSSKVLDETQVLDWARQLTSRWYPSYNTDLTEIQPGQTWPYANSNAKAIADIAGFTVANPLVIFRGRPLEDTLYNVFVVEGMGLAKAASAAADTGKAAAKSLDAGLAKQLQSIEATLQQEKKTLGGGAYSTWHRKLATFHQRVKIFAKQESPEIQGLQGQRDFLVFRRELDYLLAPDWDSLASGQKPLAAIVAFKEKLAAQGIDFLFVPIPTKLDIYPEMLSDAKPALPGGIAQPYARKVLADLAKAGVETLDLTSLFLQQRSIPARDTVLLYQKEDTHWTPQGLALAAKALAERLRGYAWFDSSFAEKRIFTLKDTTYSTLGDIQARLSAKAKATVRPETLKATQVFDPQGKPYEADENSPVLLLGDSYTGVFETVGCRHAGVTAHLAAQLQGPVDLIMGWGGGPEAPEKMAKRGEAYLQPKRVVVWMMSARDLFTYPGQWN